MRLVPVLLLALAFWPPPLRATGGWGMRYEKDFALEMRAIQEVIVDGPKKDQRLTLTVISKKAPVDVYLVHEKDVEEAARSLRLGRPVAEFIAALRGVEGEASLTVTIKAKAQFAVVVGNSPRAASVSLKLTGK